MIYSELGKVSAFNKNQRVVMSNGDPIVQWHFQVQDLEKWITTLEEVQERNLGNRMALLGLCSSLKAAHEKHINDHLEMIASLEEPDLAHYLENYAAAVAAV